jgi:molybdopterin converting factor small subunit
MNVRVRFFGPLTGVTGTTAADLSLPGHATVQHLLQHLFEKWPALRVWDASLLTAVNLAYARRGDVVPPDAEVAIMPPVQGG